MLVIFLISFETQSFNLDEVLVSTFFVGCAFGVVFKKSFPNPKSQRFSSQSSEVSALQLDL
jgi:hypothetical protein